MNEVLRPFLRCFVMVFFDVILIFSSTCAEHLCHVHAVLTILRQHLFVKRFKCVFGETAIAYLCHVIPVEGVAIDMAKV
jgi:hypothetical protein